ncbi:MAG: spondin domain-containing protein [Pseudomonadota bacterium]
MPRLAPFAAAIGLLAAAPASALEITVEIENLVDVPGISLTPVYLGFHDGTFDAFDVGAAASPQIETLAELGDFGPLRDLRLMEQPGSVGGVLASPSGPPPIEPGETASVTRTLDPTANRALSFFSMIVPSNDAFVGNDDPLEFVLFDGGGTYTGDFDILVTADFAYDAGTEVNDSSPTGGAAFLQGAVGGQGAAEGGVVAPLSELDLQALFDDFEGGTTGPGAVIVAPDVDQGFALARISVRATPASEVPLPAAAPLLAGALALLGAAKMRRKTA